jgi:hypothetical protein
MEEGRFQDFVLEFLPLYDARSHGLSRVGHIAAGKTRAGTPDLLKTDEYGQIAVQCGTDEDYWPPEDSIEGSKPYEDGLKCIEKLEHLSEITLVTNRETPARSANVKSRIIDALRVRMSANISLLGAEDLSQFLVTRVDRPAVRRVIAKFCRAAAVTIEALESADQLRVLGAVAQVRSADPKAVLPIVAEASLAAPGLPTATEYVLDRLNELRKL